MSVVFNSSTPFLLPISSCFSILTVILSLNATGSVNFITKNTHTGEFLPDLCVENASFVNQWKMTMYNPGSYQFMFTSEKDEVFTDYSLQRTCSASRTGETPSSRLSPPSILWILIPIIVSLNFFWCIIICAWTQQSRNRDQSTHHISANLPVYQGVHQSDVISYSD